MSKNTDSSIKLLILYDILLKSTDEEHALSTNEIIEKLNERGISVSRKVLPSDIDQFKNRLILLKQIRGEILDETFICYYIVMLNNYLLLYRVFNKRLVGKEF